MDEGVGREENRSLYSNSGALRVEIICRHTVRTTLGRKKKKKNRSAASSDPQKPKKQEQGVRGAVEKIRRRQV